MGLKHGAQVLYALKGLSAGDVVDICKKLAEENGTSPTIDVDCSNICFKVGKNISSLSSYLMKWAETGLCVTPVCDGYIRPISKQATNERKATRDKNRIRASIARTKLRTLRSKLYTDAESRQQTIKEIHNLEKICKTAETASNNTLPGNMPKLLSEELDRSSAHTKNSARGFVDYVVTAEWQADAYMIGRAVAKESVLMVTSDADMPVLGGDACLALKSFKKDGELEIVSTSKSSIERIMRYLTLESRDRITFVPAKYPLFENVPDRKLRAVMCLFLGCDVYDGMNGVGAKTLAVDIIQGSYESYKLRRPENEQVSLYSYLKKYLQSKTDGMNHTVIQTYICALIYEPTNTAPTEQDKADGKSYRTYVGGVLPSVLPKYLEEFAAEQTQITEGPTMERCMGVDESGHLFLAADGFVNCNNCGGVICRHCHESIGAEAYCLLCYAEKSIVPIPGEDRRGVGKSILEMRQELAEKHNFDSVDELSFEELEDFYEVKDVVYSRVNEMADVVPFPLYSSNQLDDAVCWDTLLDIDFSDGGSFITDPDLEQKYLPAVLDFFGSLVRFQSKKRTDHVKDSPIYDSMPEMLINFAENSRIDSGFRLLARTVRHSFDSRLSPMSECSAKLIIDGNGEVGIHIKSKIPASMKKNIYDSEIAATSNSLLG
jgi:hypothetical protein